MAGSATSIIFVATNSWLSRQTCAFHDKTRILSLQKYACPDKNIFYRDKHNFCLADKSTLVETKLLQRQTRICCYKSMLVAIKKKKNATKVLSRQAYFCRDTGRVLSRQKIILVAAPANDRQEHMVSPLSQDVISSRCVVKVVGTSDRYWQYPLLAPSVRYPQMV